MAMLSIQVGSNAGETFDEQFPFVVSVDVSDNTTFRFIDFDKRVIVEQAHMIRP